MSAGRDCVQGSKLEVRVAASSAGDGAGGL